MVFVRDARAEERHQPVAKELVHGAFEVMGQDLLDEVGSRVRLG